MPLSNMSTTMKYSVKSVVMTGCVIFKFICYKNESNLRRYDMNSINHIPKLHLKQNQCTHLRTPQAFQNVCYKRVSLLFSMFAFLLYACDINIVLSLHIIITFVHKNYLKCKLVSQIAVHAQNIVCWNGIYCLNIFFN